MQLGDWLEALRNLNLTLNSSNYNPRRRNNLANNVSSNTSRRRFNSTNMSNDASQVKPRANITEILNNINLTMNRLTTQIILNRGRLKFQQKPLITSDQDSASQENQIIAVKMTTLPPPIGHTKQHTHATQTSMPAFPEVSDSENKVNIQQMGVTDMVTENDGMETTTRDMETTPNIDNSQNELKRFTTLRPRTTQIEFETTTDRSFEVATEVDQTTFSYDFDEIPTTTQVYDTTTLNIDPEDNYVHTTTEKDFPTTNHFHSETDSVTEVDEDDDDEQTSITTAKRPHTTEEEEVLDSQSSTLQPKYVEIEKTTEMRNPTTEFTRTTTENVQPTTEFVTKKENKINDRLPDLESKEELTTNIINLNRDEYRYGTIKSDLLDTSTQGLHTADAFPEVIDEITHSQEQTPTTDGQIPDIGGFSIDEPDTNAIIAISVSVVGVVVVGTIVGVLFIMRKRQKQLTYGQRCRPVGMDAYSLDNVSVYNSVRRKGVLRMSKRSYGNAAFDDPGLKNNLLSATSLAVFAQKKNEIYEEFKELPTVTARAEEVPPGCEDKNRYANIIPLPESRVFLKRIGDDEKSEYINANYVKGLKDNSHYYIACQGPLDSTVIDFWRMISEQNSRVIIMATDIIENGIEQCAEYLPPSFVIDNHVTFGDFNITLKNREVKDKYAMSIVHLKNTNTNTWREVTHFWYQWPDTGVPIEQSSLIELLLEARSYLKVSTAEQIDDNENSHNNNGNLNVGNGGVDKSKSLLRTQGSLTVHCSPGTGRTGTIIACDIALRALELPTKSVDIPQIVYFVRRGRASAVRTREQYEFIYKRLLCISMQNTPIRILHSGMIDCLERLIPE